MQAKGKALFYWPAMNDDIGKLVKQCKICNKFAKSQCKEPMIPHEITARPWEKVGIAPF